MTSTTRCETCGLRGCPACAEAPDLERSSLTEKRRVAQNRVRSGLCCLPSCIAPPVVGGDYCEADAARLGTPLAPWNRT